MINNIMTQLRDNRSRDWSLVTMSADAVNSGYSCFYTGLFFLASVKIVLVKYAYSSSLKLNDFVLRI